MRTAEETRESATVFSATIVSLIAYPLVRFLVTGLLVLMLHSAGTAVTYAARAILVVLFVIPGYWVGRRVMLGRSVRAAADTGVTVAGILLLLDEFLAPAFLWSAGRQTSVNTAHNAGPWILEFVLQVCAATLGGYLARRWRLQHEAEPAATEQPSGLPKH